MNSRQRLEARLRGERVDRVPNFDIMMQFAAHHIHQPLSRYYLDHRVLCEANFAVREAYSLDLLQAISDPYREAADIGLAVEFPDDGLPVARRPLLLEPGDLLRLRSPDPAAGGRMTDRLEAVRLFRERGGGDAPVMGWVEGALAEAADLRGVGELLMDLIDRPAWVRDLLETTAALSVAFARAQVEAGADIVGLGDAIASQISPAAYREFALPYERRVFEAVREMGARGRLHICGNTSRILTDMAASGADIIDIDWMVDLSRASAAAADKISVCGNQDPVAVMLQGTPEKVRAAILACLAAGGPRWISAAGCEIPDGTPPENLRAQTLALEEAAA